MGRTLSREGRRLEKLIASVLSSPEQKKLTSKKETKEARESRRRRALQQQHCSRVVDGAPQSAFSVHKRPKWVNHTCDNVHRRRLLVDKRTLLA
jgi:hypothetical protein